MILAGRLIQVLTLMIAGWSAFVLGQALHAAAPWKIAFNVVIIAINLVNFAFCQNAINRRRGL